jgi:hypothetical protein
VEKVARIFASFEEADEADRQAYERMSPQQRVEMLLSLRRLMVKEGGESADWKEFLPLLNSRGAEYVVVGAFALAFHSEPRFTGDLDLLIHRTPDNAKRVIDALKIFGFASLGITSEDLLSEGRARVLAAGRGDELGRLEPAVGNRSTHW